MNSPPYRRGPHNVGMAHRRARAEIPGGKDRVPVHHDCRAAAHANGNTRGRRFGNPKIRLKRPVGLQTKTPAPIRYAPVPDRRAPFPAMSPAVPTAVAKNFKAFTKCSPKRCVRPDKRQVSWVDQVRDSKLEFLAGMTFLAGGSNKCSNKKLRYRKMLVTSVLSITTIALLRRWLWVRAPPNPIFRLAGSMRSMATQ